MEMEICWDSRGTFVQVLKGVGSFYLGGSVVLVVGWSRVIHVSGVGF